MKFNTVIEKLMTENSLSQQKFADIIGVHQTTVGQWLCGKKKPGYDNILAICEKFKVEPNDFFDINKKPL